MGIQERYEGDPEGCSPFLTNCSILFALQPYTFATEEARVAYAITHLTGRARLWGPAEWERRTPACSSFQVFTSELQRVFAVPSRGLDHHDSLFGLRQGGRTVADYSIDFRTRVHRSGWNTVAQCDAFLEGLDEYVKDGLVPYDLPRSLNELIELSTRVDGRIRARRRERRQGPPKWRSPVSRPAPPTQEAEPMQVGRTSLTPEEWSRRRQGNLCLYCGPGWPFRVPLPGKRPDSPVEGGL